ncbi:hypothetical protein JTE90_022350 [Oedothorax gibbosus]|uniref:MHD1 domain-containing protein n=1 Tax=Oedothorax gibbosus TaxID=931172 RepID=A0AAV6VYF8_9ARAC|nr:hypothetical protein JTE90_022350 [Oedothorax gibbosus]
MDEEDFEELQLQSLSEVIEIYYQLFKKEMEISSAETKGKNGYDGSLLDESAVNMAEFAGKNNVSAFSQTLAELLTMLEWQYEKKLPEIQDSAIYNALLRVEKAAKNTSSWELYGKEDDGLLIALTSFEVNMLEQTISMYLTDALDKSTSQTLFFPLTDFYKSDTLVKWRILEKMASMKITPEQTIYKHKLTDCISRRIQVEAGKWLTKEFQKLKLSGKSSVLKDAETLTKILKDFESQMMVAIDVTTTAGAVFREAYSCGYFDCLSKAMDEKIHPVCLQIMQSMDTYQEYHKSFHVNLRDSCALSYSLYIQIKKLVDLLKSNFKNPQTFKLEECSSMFVKCFMNLLQVIKLECHNRIKRAVETEEKDSVHTEEKILSSSVIVLNCFCTVIDEWKHIEIEDEDLKTAFLIKISDSICDGAKIYAEALDNRIPKNSDDVLKDFEFTKKICTLSNSVEHVRRYLEDLPRQMLWKESLSKSSQDEQELPDEDSSGYSDQVLRILDLVHKSMDSHLRGISLAMMKMVVASIQTQCEKLLSSWIQSVNPNQTFDKFFHCFNEYLESIHDSLKEALFPQFLSQLWLSILMYIQKEFQEGLPPEHAKSLKQNISELMDYLVYIKMEESETHRPLLQQMVSILDLNSKTTVDLQLEYFSQVAESIVSPVEYLGHIAFQAGYKVIDEDLIDLYINIQKGQRIPARKCEMNELYVKLQLFPGSMFPNQIALKSTPATEDLDNPIFNQFFQFSNLPLEVLSVKGAVIQVLVLNETKSFSGEAVLLLNQVQNMSGFSSLEFLPVYLMALRKFDMSQISYQVLENRSKWDKNAKTFINSRKKLVKNQKKFLTCIPGKLSCTS